MDSQKLLTTFKAGQLLGRRNKFWRYFDSLPILLATALAAFGSVATALLLLGQLRSQFVWPLGLLAAAGAAFAILRYYPIEETKDIERRACNVLVLIGVLIWGVFNIFYTSQHIITNRDPGTYTNAGIWLVHHDNLNIPISSAFGSVPNVAANSAGFDIYTAHGASHIYAQGLHLLPVFLGLIGRVVGVAHMLHANVLFGMTALLAIYSFTRLITRPLWAMAVTGALAGSMPFLYFSRDTYTEMLAATFTFGALALVWLALKSRKLSLWFLAGLVAGAGTMTRIDGFLTIAGLLAFLVVMLATAKRRDRPEAVKQSLMLSLGMGISGLLGWLDVSLLSTPYYISTLKPFEGEIALILAIIVLGISLVASSWRTKLLSRVDSKTVKWRAGAAALLVLGVVLFLASRPLWQRAYNPITAATISTPTRNYEELTLQWVSWYIGPLLAMLGVIGLAISAHKIMLRRNLLLIASFIVIGSTSLFYLYRPDISPDQIWAARRLVPVILPGVAAFGAIAIGWIYDEIISNRVDLRSKYILVVFTFIALLLGPLITSRPEILNHDTDLLAPLNSVCSSLPKNAAVLWLGTTRTQLVQPTSGICGVPSLGYGGLYSKTDAPSKQILSQVAMNAEKNHYVPVVGLYTTEKEFLIIPDQTNLTDVADFVYQRLENANVNPPRQVIRNSNSILIGLINRDGTLTPLSTL